MSNNTLAPLCSEFFHTVYTGDKHPHLTLQRSTVGLVFINNTDTALVTEAICSHGDQFCKAIGRAVTTGRIQKVLDLVPTSQNPLSNLVEDPALSNTEVRVASIEMKGRYIVRVFSLRNPSLVSDVLERRKIIYRHAKTLYCASDHAFAH